MVDVLFFKQSGSFKSSLNNHLNNTTSEASPSASFESLRSEGGGRGFIREVVGHDPFVNYLERIIWTPKTGQTAVYTDLCDRFRTRDLRCHVDFDGEAHREFLGISDVESTEFLEEVENGGVETIKVGEKKRKISEDYGDYCSVTDKRNLQCKVACVTEPLKVRVLTKGEAIPQYVVKPLQELMWKCLRDFDMFALIGEPVESSHISSLLRKALMFYGLEFKDGDWFIVSGDYSAATDGLNPYISKKILSRILTRIKSPEWFNEYSHKVLGMHTVEYDEASGLEPAVQQKGQLMGSVLSFPILCLQNLLTILLSNEAALGIFEDCKKTIYDRRKLEKLGKMNGRKYGIKRVNEIPLFINGDDILFPVKNDAGYWRWREILPHVGFTMSQGKNLCSRKLCTVNSVMFKVGRFSKKIYQSTTGAEFESQCAFVAECGWKCRDKTILACEECLVSTTREIWDIDVEVIKYLNIGLLQGQSKINNRSGSKDSPLWDIYNHCFDNTSNVNLMTMLFWVFNSEKLKRVSKDGLFNHFLPRALGGCGFKGKAKYYTTYQLKLGKYLYKRHTREGKLLGEDLGLVNKISNPFSKAVDRFEGYNGYRARKFDVPNRGLLVRPPLVTGTPIMGGPGLETDLETRFPIRLPKEQKIGDREKTIEKLLSFTDDLKILVRVHKALAQDGSSTKVESYSDDCELSSLCVLEREMLGERIAPHFPAQRDNL